MNNRPLETILFVLIGILILLFYVIPPKSPKTNTPLTQCIMSYKEATMLDIELIISLCKEETRYECY